MKHRAEEIRQLNRLSPQQVIDAAGDHLVVCDNIDELHRRLAESIYDEIQCNNEAGQSTRLILPVGPTGQYPILAQLLRESGTSLANCHFFFMDEYCGNDGKALPVNHPLSFRGNARSQFLNKVGGCGLKPAQVFFPDENNIASLPGIIDSVGGIDTCYGGIGIHGHLAFNEPEPGVSQLPCRKVRLNDFTRDDQCDARRGWRQPGGISALRLHNRHERNIVRATDPAVLPQWHRARLGEFGAASSALRRAGR